MPEGPDGDDLAAVVRALRQASRVVYLCGAGLSVPSGIRAYRSGPNAVWDELVTDWGTRTRFLADPATWWKTFWLEAHGDLFRRAQPNEGHQALVRLMRRNANDLVVTQNIDGLHRLAGHPEAQLIEIHGRHDRFCCTRRGCEGVDSLLDQVDLSAVDQGVIPRCAHCASPLRPVVLLFDEQYDSHPLYQAWRARKALNAAEVMVFIGTSFSVGITSYTCSLCQLGAAPCLRSSPLVVTLRCAEVSGALAVNVNLEAAGYPRVVNLLSGAQVLLPDLASRVLEGDA